MRLSVLERLVRTPRPGSPCDAAIAGPLTIAIGPLSQACAGVCLASGVGGDAAEAERRPPGHWPSICPLRGGANHLAWRATASRQPASPPLTPAVIDRILTPPASS